MLAVTFIRLLINKNDFDLDPGISTLVNHETTTFHLYNGFCSLLMVSWFWGDIRKSSEFEQHGF